MKLQDYVINKPVIRTDRLVLRQLQPSDVPALLEWMPDKSMYRFWGKNAGKSDKNPSLLFEHSEKPSKSFHWGIEFEEKVVGEIWIYLIENDRMAKLAYRVAPSCQGKGIATEAVRSAVDFCFKNTELKRIWSDVDVRNIASIRVLEKSVSREKALSGKEKWSALGAIITFSAGCPPIWFNHA